MQCDMCTREGQLVQQFVTGPHKLAGINEHWVFRYYLCRWHRSSENRGRKNKLRPIDYIEDSILLKEIDKE